MNAAINVRRCYCPHSTKNQTKYEVKKLQFCLSPTAQLPTFSQNVARELVVGYTQTRIGTNNNFAVAQNDKPQHTITTTISIQAIGLSTKTRIERLPSLPQVLLQILDAIHSDQADFQRIADIIRQDAAVTTRLLEIANSSFYGRGNSCNTIERALLFLGTETVKTIVITTATKQFFNQFEHSSGQFLQGFWRRSLVAANFAQVLATLTSYRSPDEAYLCGLLTDVGQLMLLTEHNKQYQQLLDDNPDDQQLVHAERQQLSTTHCDTGAQLVESWSIDGFMSDALRYHHEDSQQIQDAHQLVKIINLASLISMEGDIDDKAIEASHSLFGLNESLTRELRGRINKDVINLALSFGIDLDQSNNKSQQEAHQQLGRRLSELNELAHISNNLGHSPVDSCLNNAIRRAAFFSLGIENSLLFVAQPEQLRLAAWLDSTNPEPDFAVAIEPGRSAIADSQLNDSVIHVSLKDDMTVIDRQLLRHFQADRLYCLPLTEQNQTVAVLVCGLTEQQRR